MTNVLVLVKPDDSGCGTGRKEKCRLEEGARTNACLGGD